MADTMTSYTNHQIVRKSYLFHIKCGTGDPKGEQIRYDMPIHLYAHIYSDRSFIANQSGWNYMHNCYTLL